MEGTILWNPGAIKSNGVVGGKGNEGPSWDTLTVSSQWRGAARVGEKQVGAEGGGGGLKTSKPVLHHLHLEGRVVEEKKKGLEDSPL